MQAAPWPDRPPLNIRSRIDKIVGAYGDTPIHGAYGNTFSEKDQDVRSGKLRHRIEIQQSTDTRDGFGAVSGQTWNLFCYAWASIEPLSGREYFAAAQTQSEVSHKITMRYKAGIKTYFRVTWNDRIFNILSVINTREENRELILYCSEVVSP